MIDDYTRLLESVAELGDEHAAGVAIDKLIHHLASSGRIKMLPQIATELKKVVRRREAARPVLEVAHEREKPTALREAKAAGIEANRVFVNPALIQGWRARAKGKLVDRSVKSALVDIYQKVIG